MGSLIPAAWAAAELIFDCSTVAPSASTLGSFMLASTPSVEALWGRRVPWFPMYDRPSIVLPLSWRWYVTDQFCQRGKVNPFGVTASGAVPLAKAGSMKGGIRYAVLREAVVEIERGRDAV